MVHSAQADGQRVVLLPLQSVAGDKSGGTALWQFGFSQFAPATKQVPQGGFKVRCGSYYVTVSNVLIVWPIVWPIWKCVINCVNILIVGLGEKRTVKELFPNTSNVLAFLGALLPRERRRRIHAART